MTYQEVSEKRVNAILFNYRRNLFPGKLKSKGSCPFKLLKINLYEVVNLLVEKTSLK